VTRGPGPLFSSGELRWLRLLPPLLAAVFFYPITRNYFLFDDFLHLYGIANGGFLEYALAPHAGHLLFGWKALFALLFRLLGPDPAAFFAVVWLNHVGNAALLFEAIRWLAGSPRLACLGASLWAIAPIHAGSLDWYSVHGHVLATTAVLWILGDLARLSRGAPGARLAPWRWAALALFAATSFGVGLAAALVLPAVAFLVVPEAAGRGRATRLLAGIALGVLGACAALGWLAGALAGTPYSLPLDVLQQTLGWSLAGRTLELAYRLAARGVAGLLLGFLGDGLGPTGAGLHLTFAAALAGLAWALRLADPPIRRGAFGVLLLALAAWGTVAVARGLLTPILFPLDLLADAGRYQYLATAALALALCQGAAALSRHLSLPARSRTPILALALALQALLVAWRRPPIDHHELVRREVEAFLARMRQEIEAAPPGADVFLLNLRDQLFAAGYPVAGPLAQGQEAFPSRAALFTIFFPENEVAGRRIFFLESDPDVLAAARSGRRTATLLVPSRELPPGLGPVRRGSVRPADSRRPP
jgi:hypothetical protein